MDSSNIQPIQGRNLPVLIRQKQVQTNPMTAKVFLHSLLYITFLYYLLNTLLVSNLNAASLMT